jgi:glycine cleavage system H lipoate-binding protein
LAGERPSETDGGKACPNLHQSLMQFCSAASLTKFVPYSESFLSRCTSGWHRYCELFASHAESGLTHEAGAGVAPNGVDGVELPEGLVFARNHTWIDQHEDGSCHIGVDHFLTRLLGKLDRLTFVTARGVCRPAAVLTVRGVDLQVIFPERVQLSGPNTRLKTDLGQLGESPYTRGWLFEGRAADAPSGEQRTAAGQGFVSNGIAREWMAQENRRLSAFVQEKLSIGGIDGTRTLADGGTIAPGLFQHLGHDDILALYHEFFSPFGSWRES